ncbi:AAA family ATPase, partial [Methanoregula sp.]|uniref:AAA family ATPase n=1 Tax=Methanoregula sp. TaxID=2052170 RepID=UPI003C74BC95
MKIEHFKSIESLDIDCNQINIFIGEPNTGKSNILEALALFTFMDQMSATPLSSYIRFKDLSNLFTDGILDRNVILEIRKQDLNKPMVSNAFGEGKYEESIEKITIKPESESYKLTDQVKDNSNFVNKWDMTFDFSGNSRGGGGILDYHSGIKYYIYKEFSEYIDLTSDALKPPF